MDAGANMGGKSTLLRTCCTAVIMAQVGCYIPATAATLSPVDGIFTRIGAHDRIMSGQSTFMVEMSETAMGLAVAGRNSLMILDELGRGTSTVDGYALAYAVLKHVTRETRCRVLFATHYHNLTLEPDICNSVQMGHMATQLDSTGGLLPLYQLQPRPAPRGSCGIEVGAVAGLPAEVVARAMQMAAALEQHTAEVMGQ